MTEDEILALEGVELDAAVATEFYGWHVDTLPHPKLNESMNIYRNKEGQLAELVPTFAPTRHMSHVNRAEDEIPEDEWPRWFFALRTIVGAESHGCRLVEVNARTARATATQRCKALLIWKLRHDKKDEACGEMGV